MSLSILQVLWYEKQMMKYSNVTAKNCDHFMKYLFPKKLIREAIKWCNIINNLIFITSATNASFWLAMCKQNDVKQPNKRKKKTYISIKLSKSNEIWLGILARPHTSGNSKFVVSPRQPCFELVILLRIKVALFRSPGS